MTKNWNRENRISDAAKELRLEQRIEQEWLCVYRVYSRSPLMEAVARLFVDAVVTVWLKVVAEATADRQKKLEHRNPIDAKLQVID